MGSSAPGGRDHAAFLSAHPAASTVMAYVRYPAKLLKPGHHKKLELLLVFSVGEEKDFQNGKCGEKT